MYRLSTEFVKARQNHAPGSCARLIHRVSIFIPNTKTTMKMAFRWAVLTLHSTNQRSESRGPITEIFGTTIALVDCRLGQRPWRKVDPQKNDYRQTAGPAGVVLKSHPLHNYTRLQAKNARGVQLRCTLRVQTSLRGKCLHAWTNRLRL